MDRIDDTDDRLMLLDALSYADRAISDQERQLSKELISQEMKTFRPCETYLSNLIYNSSKSIFGTDLLCKELVDIESKVDRPPSSILAKLDLDIPPTPTGSIITDSEIYVWQRCLKLLKIKLEYLQRQLINLELLKVYGEPTWNQYLEDFDRLKSCLEKELTELNEKIRNDTSDMKRDQEQVFKVISVLTTKWRTLIGQNHILALEIRKLNG